MTPYSHQLCDGADEVMRYFQQNQSHIEAELHPYERLADEMRRAADLENTAAVEASVHAIARWIVDDFPLTDDFAPSFRAALHAVQHAERRRKRNGRSR